MKKLSVRPSGAGLGNTNFMVPNCPFFIVVPNCPFLHGGAKLSVFTWRCQIVRGAKLSVLHDGAKLSGCQIVRFYIAVPNCPFFIAVPNCPRCQIVLESSAELQGFVLSISTLPINYFNWPSFYLPLDYCLVLVDSSEPLCKYNESNIFASTFVWK